MLPGMPARLALHTWTLLSTPVPDIVKVAAQTGWEAIEISRQSVAAATPLGLPLPDIAKLVKASGLPWHLEDAGHAGMGDSIAAAVAATQEANGWLVLPGDLPKGSPVQVRCGVGSNGRIEVMALDMTTGRMAKTEIHRPGGLTDQEIANEAEWVRGLTIQ